MHLLPYLNRFHLHLPLQLLQNSSRVVLRNTNLLQRPHVVSQPRTLLAQANHRWIN